MHGRNKNLKRGGRDDDIRLGGLLLVVALDFVDLVLEKSKEDGVSI